MKRRSSGGGCLFAFLCLLALAVGCLLREFPHMDPEMQKALTSGGLCAALVAIHFLPSLVAAFRGHPSGNAIGIVNLFLGWTLIGWVVALAWSLTGIDD